MDCWNKGYISATHGGGTTAVLQTNDVGLHKPLRKDYIEAQSEFLLDKSRSVGGGLCDCTDEECITLMASVMSKTALHEQACKGFKTTGLTAKLDGTEDGKVGGDAKVFWGEFDVRERINTAVAAVKKG